MPYNAPPQINTNNTAAPQYSHQRQNQESIDMKARWAASQTESGAAVLDMSRDSDGCPRKAHIRDANGHVKTVTFDGNQNVTQTQDGYN